MKYLTLIIFFIFSASTFACKCIPSDVDTWFSESVEVAHVRVVSTLLEVDSETDEERVKVKYQVVESFKKKEASLDFVYEGLHNCALGIKTGNKYIFYIREHRIISRCGGSRLIYNWTDKGIQMIEQLRMKALNKSKYSDSVNAAGI